MEYSKKQRNEYIGNGSVFVQKYRLALFVFGVIALILLTSTTGVVAEENNELLNCLCGCLSPSNFGGEMSCEYDTEDKGYSPSCRDMSNGPCICKGFGCIRRPLPASREDCGYYDKNDNCRYKGFSECYDKCHDKFSEKPEIEDSDINGVPDKECTASCRGSFGEHMQGVIKDGECICKCEDGYNLDENLATVACVPTKETCNKYCLEYHGITKIHGPEAYGEVEGGVCNCHCKDGYKPDKTLTCIKVEETPTKPELSPNAKLARILQLYHNKIPKGITDSGPKNNLLSWFNSTYKEYVCGGYQGKVLEFLDGLKYSKDPSEQSLLDDWDYGPIQAYWGGHQAVVIYPKGTNWVETGIVLDPWITQSPKSYAIQEWAMRFGKGSYHGIGGSEVYENNPRYPTVGGNHQPPSSFSFSSEEREFISALPPDKKERFIKMDKHSQFTWIKRKMSQQKRNTIVMANCPLDIYVMDATGRISGFRGGEARVDIADVLILRLPLTDGTYWSVLEYPQDEIYKLVMEGTDNGEADVFIGFGMENEPPQHSIYRYHMQVAPNQEYEIEPNIEGSPIKSDGALINPIKVEGIDQAWLDSESDISYLPEFTGIEVPADTGLPSTDPSTPPCTGTSTHAYIESRTMEKGKEVSIPVMMCNANDLAHMDFSVSYDSTVLRFKNADKGSLNSKSLFESNEISSGNIKIAFASSKGVSDSGSIAILTFDVIGSNGDYSSLTGSVNTADTSSGSPISITIKPGKVTVGGKKTIYVDDDFTDDPANHKWDTIHEGITDANAEDTVLVYNGRYTETVVLNKRLTLIGEGMPEIDAQSLGDAINIKADNCTVKGFNCVNAQPSPYAGIRVNSSNNVIVDNTCKDNYIGIYLLGSSNEIRNNIASSNNKYGIRVQASDGNIISNNTVKENGYTGIYLQVSNDNRIADNDVSNNVKYDGISVSSSNNNEVRNNVADSNHYDGIRLLNSTDNIISNNTVKENGYTGIYLQVSNDNRIADNDVSNNHRGISVSFSNNNEVRNNVADSNHDGGIRLWKSTDNTISNNTVKNNEDDGISLDYSSNNRIYMNNFMDNQNDVYSTDSTNIWHSTSERIYRFKGNTHTNYLGNYWDDYTGSDTDNDGIGDISYNINSDNNDNYPLKEPVENYFLPIRLEVVPIFFP